MASALKILSKLGYSGRGIWDFAIDVESLTIDINLFVLIPFTTLGVQVGKRKIDDNNLTHAVFNREEASTQTFNILAIVL